MYHTLSEVGGYAGWDKTALEMHRDGLSDMTFVLRPEGRKTRTLNTNSSKALRYVYSEIFCILTM